MKKHIKCGVCVFRVIVTVPMSAYILGLLLGGTTLAQESSHYKLTEHVLNAGGNQPTGVLASPSFRITFAAIGDGFSQGQLRSSSYVVDGGFVAAYPPPGEVSSVQFTTQTALAWDRERSVGTYNLYSDALSALPGLAYGTCAQSGLGGETAVVSSNPPAGGGYFYLITAKNRLGEEGTKGVASSGAERGNSAPCP